MISFKLSSINSKLFMIILLFVCIPLLVLGFIWFEKTTETIEENAVQYSQHLLTQTNEYMDFYLHDLEQATYPFLSNPQVQQFLDMNSLNSNRYKRFIISQQIQDEAFSPLLNGRSDIYGISLINQNGMQVHNYSKVNNYLNMDYIRQMNKELWEEVDKLEPYQFINIDFIHSTPVLTIVRKVYDKNTYNTSGLLIVNLRLNQISNIINEVTLSHFEQVWIVNDQNKIIYHPNEDQLGQTFSSKQATNQMNDRFFIQSHESLKTLMVYDYSPQSNWTMVANVPMNQIMANLISLRNSTIWIGLILIGIALLFIGGFSFSLTYSLTTLQNLMKKAQSGKLNIQKKQPLPLYRNDEISDLYNSFYNMTGDLDRLMKEIQHSKLIEKEMELKTRESELQAMQSQINPHFLYNTLEIINSHAIIEKQMMISKMTTSLADMFRYNVSNTKSVVTLEEEINQIQTYLDIQRERFEDLDVFLEVSEEEIQEVLTARLTIQPIIENAFIHGYEEYELTPTFIGIYGEPCDDYYKLSIVDQGKGMNEQTQTMFNQAFTHHEDPPTDNKTTKRIGLINVHKRIFGNFGSPFGIYISKSDESGTMIEVRLPYTTTFNKREA